MFYYHIVFDDFSKPSVQKDIIELSGFPNGTIFDRGQHVKSPNLPQNEWIMSFRENVDDLILEFHNDSIKSIQQVNSEFVFLAQRIQV